MKETKSIINETITTLRNSLGNLIGDWETDNSTPPNFERKTGLGVVVARVDVRCGGYQSAHEPLVIGYKSMKGSLSMSDLVLVSKYAGKEEAIKHAMELADADLKTLNKGE